jgi:RimJ/RimL family protein N-acetyltransferase
VGGPGRRQGPDSGSGECRSPWEEELAVRRLDADTAEICCVPFLQTRLALGDVVRINARCYVGEVTRPSGRVTFAVRCAGGVTADEFPGAVVEEIGTGLSAVAASAEDAATMDTRLRSWEDDGRAEYRSSLRVDRFDEPLLCREQENAVPDDLVLRPISGPDELNLFNQFRYVLNSEVGDDLAAGRRRPEWLWVALRGDRVVARAGWWSRPGDEQPLLQLLNAALPAPPPEYRRFLPPDWRDHPEAVENVMATLERTGAKLFVERLRLEWRPGTPIAEPSDRLTFRPIRDPGELIDLMTLVLDGTLDAHSRDELTRMTARESAEEQYHDELERYTSPHSWWRIATLPDGEPVGFVIPAHNGYNPIIAYLAVVPAHRGRGYIHDVLAMGTRILAAEDVPRIRAATDVSNVPMAAAFARAGYVTFERQIDMTWQ